jgi:protein-L-isoaspartate(D-aspartate) O-methyltransferase
VRTEQADTERRQFFAALVNASVRSTQPNVIAAFGNTPREAFLGPGPWQMFVGGGYVSTPTNDPSFVYCDVPIRLKGDINNGQPSLHAACLAALNVAAGHTAVHIGAGSGYYTAMLAQLVGDDGVVHAYEIDTELAHRARGNLVDYPQVHIHNSSAVGASLPDADVIYVNAGATHPSPEWLDALRVGARLLFPLTPASGPGAMLLVTRTTADRFAARFVCPAMFIGCAGGRDEAMAAALTEAFKNPDWRHVQSLRRDMAPDESCWYGGAGWWLSTADPERA